MRTSYKRKKIICFIVFCLFIGMVQPNTIHAIYKDVKQEKNLVLDKGVLTSCSSEYTGNDKENAIDGKKETRWSSQKTAIDTPQSEWLKIDLGKDQVIDQIRLNFQLGPQKYRVRLTKSSNDPSGEYTKEHKGVRQDVNATFKDVIDCNGVEARYIEFIGIEQALFKNDTKKYTPWGYSISEFEIIQYIDDQDIIDIGNAIKKIQVKDIYYTDDKLPIVDETYGVEFKWHSDNENFKIDEISGSVKITNTEENQNVNLTLEANKNGKKVNESFSTIIGEKALSDEECVDSAYKELTFRKHSISTFEIPLKWSTGLSEVKIDWKTDSDLLIVDGNRMIVKQCTEEKNVKVVATLTKGSISKNKEFITTLNPGKRLDLNIFPKPHSVISLGGRLDITNIKLEYLGNYGKTLINRVNTIVEELNINVSKNNNTKLIFATLDEKDDISDYLDESEYSIENSILNHDGYIIKINPNNNTILLFGKDESSLFNAITTLKLIINNEKNIDGMLIEDYADVEFRGYIEGFYGSWTHQQRLSLLEDLSDSKMNTYIYGSKSDKYHTKNWRELYPEKDNDAVMDLNRLKELVTTAKENNIEFVWGAHTAGIDFSSEDDFNKLITKYDQLYDVGVRQFAIFFDDGGTKFKNASTFINRLNREYIRKKEGVGDLIYCPQGYNFKFAKPDEWAEIKKFDKDIQVMFTGTTTMSEINEKTLQRIKETIGRTPYIWWNYPVNDLDMSKQLVIGPIVGLDRDVSYMPGLVSNPMFQAESSKVALYSIADYLWNIDAFNSYDSWEHAINTMIKEENIREAYKLFALNVSVMGKQEFAYISEESEYLSKLLDSILIKYRNGKDCTKEVAELQKQNTKLKNAIEILKNSSDIYPNLIKEMDKWLKKGEKVCDWLGQVLVLVEDYKGGTYSKEKVAIIGNKPQIIRANIDNCNGKHKDEANFGQYRILPFIYDLTQAIEGKVSNKISGFGTLMIPYKNVIDGDFNTKVSAYGIIQGTHNFMRSGLYFGTDLNSPKFIKSIHANISKLQCGDIEISNDLKNWEKIGEVTKEKTDVKITNINKIAKYIRVINRNNQQDVMVISELQIDYEKLANYDEVNNAIEAANKLNRDLYDNFSKVDEVIKAVVKNLESSKQDIVDGYAEAIYKAISELKLKLADYSKVDSAIEKAKALNEDNYKDFSKVKDAINKVVYDLDITKQEEVNEMAKAIEDAIKALEKNEVGNKGKLQEVINKKPLKDEQAYTKASWKAYEEALEKANKVLANEKATQKEIDDATKALQDAYAKLKENPDLTPIGPSEQVIPMTPLKPSTPVDSTETEKPSTTDKVENGEKPSTGVSTNTNLLWIIVFVGSIVVLVSTKKYLDKN